MVEEQRQGDLCRLAGSPEPQTVGCRASDLGFRGFMGLGFRGLGFRGLGFRVSGV